MRQAARREQARTRRAVWPPIFALVIAGALTAWGLVSPIAAYGNAAQLSPATVLSVSATPNVLPAGGGVVAVTGTLQNATSCRLEVRSSQSFPVIYSDSPRDCSGGIFNAHITIGANPSPTRRAVSFELVASNKSSSFTAGFNVVMGAQTPASILSVSSAPSTLASGGGQVTVTGTVQHASTCRLELLSSQSFPVIYSDSPKSCTSGTFSAQVTIGANPSPVSRTVSFDLVARNATSSLTSAFQLTLAPKSPQVLVQSVQATPSFLPAGGGQVTVSGTVQHATSCQLVLQSSQSFPVVYSRNAKGCAGGEFSAQVTIGANPSPISRTVSFDLLARNNAASSRGGFYVTLDAPPAPTTTTTVADLIIVTGSMPDGSVGVPYDLRLQASGGL